jgi:SGNH domain (fused to AT3 domains)
VSEGRRSDIQGLRAVAVLLVVAFHAGLPVTDNVPWFPFDAVACKYRTVPILPFTQCSQNRKLFEKLYSTYYPELKAAVDKVPGVRLLNTAHYFCDDYLCSMNKGEALLYRNDAHLNNIGSRFLVNRMLTDFPEFRAAVTQP